MKNVIEVKRSTALLSLSLLGVLSLSACGGGGGGVNPVASNAPTSENEPNQVSTPVNEEIVESTPELTVPLANGPSSENNESSVAADVEATRDLESSTDFIFATSYDLPLDIDVSAMSSSPEHLVICKEFGLVDDTMEIDYSDCILRADLVDGVFKGELKLTNDTQMLVAALWYYDAGKDPVTVAWSQADNPEGFTIR